MKYFGEIRYYPPTKIDVSTNDDFSRGVTRTIDGFRASYISVCSCGWANTCSDKHEARDDLAGHMVTQHGYTYKEARRVINER